MLIDTHCHIHDKDYKYSLEEVLDDANKKGVELMLCVGTDEDSSCRAIDISKKSDRLFPVVGIHPHEAKFGCEKIKLLAKDDSVVGIGEIGLDYFYSHSTKEDQFKVLEQQLQIAQDLSLPVSFHVREAFDDFWPIFDNFRNIKGVLHSFTDNKDNLKRGLDRGLYIGVNGISTFTKDVEQKEVFNAIPIDKIVFETDSPYLTPSPFRGKVNMPGMVLEVAKHMSNVRDISIDEISKQTSKNAKTLFNI